MLIDSNIFLEVFLEQDKMENCKAFLNKTISGKINTFVSDFSVDSILIAMENNNIDSKNMKEFLEKLSKSEGIRIYSVSMKDRIRALHFMKFYKLDYEDSIILQSAISSGCEEIVSFDKHFDKVKEVRRIEPIVSD